MFAENTSRKRRPCLTLASLKRFSLPCEMEDIKAVFASSTSFFGSSKATRALDPLYPNELTLALRTSVFRNGKAV